MTVPPETTWERNASSQIILNSIFAALSAALIGVIITNPQLIEGKLEFVSLILLSLSFFFLAISAENMVDALDEHDVKKYAYNMLPYNLGAICIGITIELLIYDHFGSQIRNFLNLGNLPNWMWWLMWIIVIFILLLKWIRDAFYLFFESKEKFDGWLEELEDKHPAKEDHHFLMKIFYCLRKSLHE